MFRSVPGCSGCSGVPVFRCSGVPVFRCSGVPRFSTYRENQIIVPCKEPIKIEKPLQCLLTFSYSAGEKYSSDCFVDICFFSFYFLIAFQSDNNSNRVYVLGHKLFCFINQVDIRAKLPTSPLDSWVYVKRGTHPEPAGTCRNLPEPPGT